MSGGGEKGARAVHDGSENDRLRTRFETRSEQRVLPAHTCVRSAASCSR